MASDGEALRDAAFEALLGEVLRECAQDPLLLVEAVDTGSALLRIARTPELAPPPAKYQWLRPIAPLPERRAPRPPGRVRDSFDEILVVAYESVSEVLVGWAAKQVGDRGDAEDIVQTALMRVYARQPDITRVDEMRSYLWATVKNLVRDAWRRAAAERERVDPDGEERIAALAERAGLPFEDLITLRHLLIAALDQLPNREREAVVLRTYEGNTYAETAEIMGLSSGTVKAYVHNALAKVRAGLNEVA
ncbi:RNA polymerase sigma factor [Nocardia crassostreae]|uniref:RNA polymerase sigma factor n=1 Tax=Nocardia crassostreae TaxID=53428 RepID=UPI000AC9E655|nr:RNA polymerase sigma factor [Nocardia crassostreae]